MPIAHTLQAQAPARTPWRLDWLTPRRCRFLLAIILAAGFLLHLRYLTHNCPVDLSPDEAQYWDWSRRLDIGYYSKGPLVAWIIRASCAIFGDTMTAVRLPAMALGIGTSLLTYWLARKLSGSDRIALGAVLLNHLVPMFIAGSILMTIDPPFFFCWAAATSLAAKAVLDDQPLAWLPAGLAAGVGVLAKYGMLLWIPQLLIFLAAQKDARRHLRSPCLWLGLAIAISALAPMALWNSRHGWPTLQHVAHQTGARQGALDPANITGFFAGQLGALGPTLSVILIAAIASALSRWSDSSPAQSGTRFLLWTGLPFFCWTGLSSLRAKVQVNWPAPAYFSLLILATLFLASRLANRQTWRPWRGWFWATLIIGLACMPLAHNTEILYAPINRLAHLLRRNPPRSLTQARWDPSHRLRGWRDLGSFVSGRLRTLDNNPFILCERYDFAAEMAFYAQGQPLTFCLGTWFADPDRRTRHSQYDFWPDRSLDRPELIGRDAIFIGYGREGHPLQPPDELLSSFDSVEPIEQLDIRRAGIIIRTFNTWRCRRFHGMSRPAPTSHPNPRSPDPAEF